MARINGTDSKDSIRGTMGDDIMHGFQAGDALAGAGGDDVIYGDRGDDYLWGDAGRDTLYGGTGDDVLRGGYGNDVLQGGPGSDWYEGGEGDGKDRFVFSDVTDNGHTNEFVADFAFNDILDFSQIDANWKIAGNQAFRWLGNGGDFSGRGGEIVGRFVGEGLSSQTKLYLDVDGNKQADMIVTIDGGWFRMDQSHDYFVL